MKSLDRALFAGLAVCWIALAASSGTTPWPHPFWIVLLSATAAAAWMVAFYWSRRALRAYLTLVVIVAGLRSIAWTLDGATSPAAVWSIMLGSSVLVYATESRRM